jgi:hypothetical protein
MCLAAAGCGHSKYGGPTGTGASQTETISSSSGGEITVEGTTLSVPPGALPADTEITVTSTTGNPPAQFATWSSPVFKFDPDGLVFLMPVQVSLEFTGTPTDPVVMWSQPTGGFENLGGTVSGHTITTSVIHFSQGFVVPAMILPDAGSHPQDSTPQHMDGGPSGDGGGTGDGGIHPDGGGANDGGVVIHPDGGFSTDGGGGNPSDGGGTPSDGGVIHADGGGSPNDGGGSPSDGGVILSDGGGSPGADGGGGLPGSDGGVIVHDGGTAMPDASGPGPTPP